MAALFSPWGNQQFLNDNGAPATGWKIYTYTSGSSSPLATYTTAAGFVPHPNPIIIDALGFASTGPIWLDEVSSYKFVLTDANNVTRRTEDGFSGISAAASAASQWQPSAFKPSYVNENTFSLPGDQTFDFHVGRRVQITTTTGIIYGQIIASSFSSNTSVTIITESGVLDAGLSSVSLSILRNDHIALPGGPVGLGTVRGLNVTPNLSNPIHLQDMSAISVTMLDQTGGAVTIKNTSVYTNNKEIFGVNGRDTVAPLSSTNPFVCLYFIWNGTTLATLASNSRPETGPLMPTGYTHWAFATMIPVDSSSPVQYRRTFTRGATVYFDTNLGGVSRVISGGRVTTYVNLNLINLVPNLAVSIKLLVAANISSGGAGSTYIVFIRAGAMTTDMQSVSTQTIAGGAGAYGISTITIPTTNSDTVIGYRLNQLPAGGGADIDVAGYSIPNGDAS